MQKKQNQFSYGIVLFEFSTISTHDTGVIALWFIIVTIWELKCLSLCFIWAVELGKRFFPRCSEVINVLVDDDDLSGLVYIQNGTPEERQLKKRRFMEIQEAFIKAFHEDKEELGKSFNISSSSRPLGGVGRPNVKEELDKSINLSSSARPLRVVGRPNGKLPRKK